VLAFLPSLVYFVVAPLSVSLALWLGFAAAFAVGVRAFGAARVVRLFDVCGLALFGALALYSGFVETDIGPAETGMVLETGFAITILWSLLVGRPFTTQYRWFKAPQDERTAFRRHLAICVIWMMCYGVMATIHAAAVFGHDPTPGLAGVLGLVVFAATLTFTWQFRRAIDRRDAAVPARRRSNVDKEPK